MSRTAKGAGTAYGRSPDEVPEMKYCRYTEMGLSEWGNGLVYYKELDSRNVYEVTGCYVTESGGVYVRGYLWDGTRFSHRLTPGQRERFVRRWGLVRPCTDGSGVIRLQRHADADSHAGDSKACLAWEYRQLKSRYGALHRLIVKCEAGTLGPVPACRLSLMERQASAMGEYLHCLEVRAEAEGVRLDVSGGDCRRP